MIQKLTFVLLSLLLVGSLAAQRPIQFEDMFALGRVADPQISPDGKWIAYTVTYYSLEKNNGNSDIFLVSTDGKTSRQLTFDEKSDSSPRWSPDGSQLAFISKRDGTAQLYLFNMEGGEPVKVTEVPTEVSSFIWSPDGQYFAIETEVLPEADSPEASVALEKKMKEGTGTGREIHHLLYRHWNVWRDGKYKHIMLYTREGKFVRDLTTGAYDTPPIALGSDHDFIFSRDGKSFCFVRNTDPIVAISTNNDIWIEDIDEKNVQQISMGTGNDNGPAYSPDGKFLTYMSMARPGFEADQKNLILHDLATGEERNLTAALDRSVSDYLWAPDGKKIYFFVENHGRHRIYEVDIKTARLNMLLDNHFIDAMQLSPDGKFLVLAKQAVNCPTELFRFDLDQNKLIQLTFTNQKLLSQLEMNPLEDFWFTGANNDSINLLMVKPPNFDPAKKYPLVCLIHGGPQGAWGDDFHFRWNAEMFASPGYVVIMINFHGSRGYGQKFCDAVSKNWGGWPYQDIMIGTRWAMEKFPYIHQEKVGAAGASYGGFMINWIEGHNDDGLFKCLVSHDGLYEQVSMFGATEELWFPTWEFNGYPWQEGSLYQKWNPANFVNNFKTPILIVHGEKDFRIPYTQAMQLFTAVQLQGVDSKLLIFPDEDHFVRKPQNARQWWKNVYDWLGKYLVQQ